MMEKYKLYKINDYIAFEKYFSMFKLDYISEEDIENILPKSVFIKYISALKKCEEKLKNLDKDFSYIKIWEKKQLIFSCIGNAKIDGLAYLALKEIEKNDTISSTLETFKPYKGYAKKACYDQLKTTTGRLTVSRGPRILTLPKRCRKILKSRWGSDGEVIQIDFKSLEPRIARKITGHDSPYAMYEDIQSSFEFNIDRSVIKRATISVLYGKTSEIEGISKEKSNIVLEKIKDYFNIKELIKIANGDTKNEYRLNFFGRPIWNIGEEKKHKVLNNYIQSTAVDICMLYFSELCEKLNLNYSIPIFIIHDALLFDVKKDYFKYFKEIISEGYNNNILGNFPIEITKINNLENTNER